MKVIWGFLCAGNRGWTKSCSFIAFDSGGMSFLPKWLPLAMMSSIQSRYVVEKNSLGSLDLARAVNNLQESVKNIKKNFDRALGLKDKPQSSNEASVGMVLQYESTV